ncbi:MAG: MGMT family protein [Nanoarchaeota archaeon]|nr:MGMT family protein [Nanoarchaeota archaeon]
MKNIFFSEKCYDIVKRIPKGKVMTYKSVAKTLGTNAYRVVGNAMNKSPGMPEMPCHRVVKSNGEVGGFVHGTRKKIEMLNMEGVKVKNGKVDLEEYRYSLKSKS